MCVFVWELEVFAGKQKYCDIHLKRPTPDGTVFTFHNVDLRVIQIDQLNTPIQRAVGILSIFNLLLLGYVAKLEINRCHRIKIVAGHYREAMRSVSLWGSVLMVVFFLLHIVLRAVYFFDAISLLSLT